jgi:AcrR family transcriptional regulator
MNRRERQLIERRQELLSAALGLFERKGYLETSMEEIAEAADVARATLYNHFPSKADVVLALTSSVAEEWILKGAAKLERGGSPCAAITALLVVTAEWFDAHPASAATFFHAMRELMARQTEKSPPPILVPIDWVIAAQERGELTKELAPELLVLLIDVVLRYSLIDLLSGRAKGKIAPHLKKQLDLVLHRLKP